VKLLLRAMTKNRRTFDSAVVMSSVIPSEKVLIGIAAHIDKGQCRNGWLVGGA
jgi:hypothetical protein